MATIMGCFRSRPHGPHRTAPHATGEPGRFSVFTPHGASSATSGRVRLSVAIAGRVASLPPASCEWSTRLCVRLLAGSRDATDRPLIARVCLIPMPDCAWVYWPPTARGASRVQEAFARALCPPGHEDLTRSRLGFVPVYLGWCHSRWALEVCYVYIMGWPSSSPLLASHIVFFSLLSWLLRACSTLVLCLPPVAANITLTFCASSGLSSCFLCHHFGGPFPLPSGGYRGGAGASTVTTITTIAFIASNDFTNVSMTIFIL